MVGRVKIGFAMVCVLITALVCRLFYIQVMCHEDFVEAAAVQYRVAVEGLDTRGQIYDRNMKPLTGSTYQYFYIIRTETVDEQCRELLARTGAENVSGSAGKTAKYQVFRTEEYIEEVNDLLKKNFGAYIFRSRVRYADNQIASHLIGYLNDSEKRGVSGLEYMCEEKLKAGSSRLVLMADAAGNILPGTGPEIVKGDDSGPVRNSVVTSIDSGLQRKCESLMEVPGACVVSDASTGEILALVSSPGFSPGHIGDYLDSDDDCLINRALQAAYPPGSVFKLVVAAAALDSGVCAAARTFQCTGEAAAGGVSVKCATAPPGGHGLIDMGRAMEVSCNSYFVQLGELTGCDAILAQARKMGLGEVVLKDYPEETSGNVPLTEGTVSNISIGQGTLLATPLQINRLTTIIANDGYAADLTIFPSGDITASAYVTTAASESVLSPETAAALQSMMSGTALRGTASAVRWTVPVWAKTGTAETGGPVKNCWITGFCEIGPEARRYVITVLVEDGVSGAVSALPVFEKIVRYLAQENPL